MMICLAISTLSQRGRLQRDCLDLADRLVARGHEVTIMTTRQIGAVSSAATIETIPVWARNERHRAQKLSEIVWTNKIMFDLTVGFDPMVALDVFYAGGPHCSTTRTDWLGSVWPFTPARQKMEALVFSRGRSTQIIALSRKRADDYVACWKTEPSRITVIATILERQWLRPELRQTGERELLRRTLQIPPSAVVALTMGCVANMHELDRVTDAVAGSRHMFWLVAGMPARSRERAALEKRARLSGLSARMRFLDIDDDMATILAASDVLLHPAGPHNADTAIPVALANGLPVIAAADCEHVHHVTLSGAGLVIADAGDSLEWQNAIALTLDEGIRADWSQAARSYAPTLIDPDGLQEAVFHMEKWVSERGSHM